MRYTGRDINYSGVEKIGEKLIHSTNFMNLNL